MSMLLEIARSWRHESILEVKVVNNPLLRFVVANGHLPLNHVLQHCSKRSDVTKSQHKTIVKISPTQKA
eukprot:3478799-Amphidinium_carterae.2